MDDTVFLNLPDDPVELKRLVAQERGVIEQIKRDGATTGCTCAHVAAKNSPPDVQRVQRCPTADRPAPDGPLVQAPSSASTRLGIATMKIFITHAGGPITRRRSVVPSDGAIFLRRCAIVRQDSNNFVLELAGSCWQIIGRAGRACSSSGGE